MLRLDRLAGCAERARWRLATGNVRAMRLVLSTLALLLACFVAGSAEAAVRCGVVPGAVALYDIRATGVDCGAARGVARAWRSALLADACENGRFRCSVGRYTCRAKRPARVHYVVRCTADAARVRWEIHAD